jgi:putative tricarboxylic transport membrane protein
MRVFELLAIGFSHAATVNGLVSIGVGVLIGQVVGVLPGIGPAAGMTLLLPPTFGMDPINAVMMLTGILYGGMYRGTLTSVLINVPGEASSIMLRSTYMPSHARAEREPRSASRRRLVRCGIFGTVVLVLAASVFSAVALKFHAPEFSPITVLGLTATASLGAYGVHAQHHNTVIEWRQTRGRSDKFIYKIRLP